MEIQNVCRIVTAGKVIPFIMCRRVFSDCVCFTRESLKIVSKRYCLS